MIACGGDPGPLADGSRYDPVTDTWDSDWPPEDPLGDDLLVGKPRGNGAPCYGAGIRGGARYDTATDTWRWMAVFGEALTL